MPIFSERQRAALDEIRRRHKLECAALTPGQRLARAEATRAFGRKLGTLGKSRSDESPEIWLRLLARLRSRSVG